MRYWTICVAAGFVAISVALAQSQEIRLNQVPTPSAGNEITECDHLAASPFDDNRPLGVSGVPLDQLDFFQAVEACQDALAVRPDEARFLFQLGRAMQKAAVGIDGQEEAARLYKLAADRGSAAAQSSLGIFYENGWGGLSKDEREAARLYKLAADQGVAPAQYYLGKFYETGRGGLSKDKLEAARLYKLAAARGIAPAREALSRLGLD